jgi:hypothetical protein
MPRVRLFHWRSAEAKPVIETLRAAGYTVDYLGDKANGNFRSLRDQPSPVAAVIDLTRMPSHGRYVALALRLGKTTRGIPLVFLDGDPEKLEKLKKELPDAAYTSRAKLAAVLKKIKAPANPVVPKHGIQAPPDRTTAQKLGFKNDLRVAVIDAPPDYATVVGPLPAGVSLEEDPSEVLPMTLWFVYDPDTFRFRLPAMRNLVGRTRLWIVWQKQSGRKAAVSGLTQYVIREAALAVGLVDYKACSLDQTWTGMLVTRKK